MPWSFPLQTRGLPESPCMGGQEKRERQRNHLHDNDRTLTSPHRYISKNFTKEVGTPIPIVPDSGKGLDLSAGHSNSQSDQNYSNKMCGREINFLLQDFSQALLEIRVRCISHSDGKSPNGNLSFPPTIFRTAPLTWQESTPPLFTPAHSMFSVMALG